jgi:protein disulfide-isomerase A6
VMLVIGGGVLLLVLAGFRMYTQRKRAAAREAENAENAEKAEKAEKAEEKTTEKAEEAAPKAEAEEPVEAATPEPSEEVTPEPEVIPIKSITTHEDLVSNCLHPRAQTCVLALVAQWESEKTAQAVFSLSKLSTKYIHGKRHMFPFFSVPNFVEGIKELREALEIDENVQIIALNARRGWWRHYDGDFTIESIEAWLDAMRMGEGEKKKLPQGVAHEEPKASDFAEEGAGDKAAEPAKEDEVKPESEKEPETKPEAESEPEVKPESETEPEPTQATDPEPEVETEKPVKEKVEHDEL